MALVLHCVKSLINDDHIRRTGHVAFRLLISQDLAFYLKDFLFTYHFACQDARYCKLNGVNGILIYKIGYPFEVYILFYFRYPIHFFGIIHVV